MKPSPRRHRRRWSCSLPRALLWWLYRPFRPGPGGDRVRHHRSHRVAAGICHRGPDRRAARAGGPGGSRPAHCWANWTAQRLSRGWPNGGPRREWPRHSWSSCSAAAGPKRSRRPGPRSWPRSRPRPMRPSSWPGSRAWPTASWSAARPMTRRRSRARSRTPGSTRPGRSSPWSRQGPRQETIDAQRALLAAAEAQLRAAEAAAAHVRLYAPGDGIITIRYHEPGETVGAGVPVVALLNPTDRWVRIYVAENRIGQVSLGERAAITSDSWPDSSFAGEVEFISPQAEFTPAQRADDRGAGAPGVRREGADHRRSRPAAQAGDAGGRGPGRAGGRGGGGAVTSVVEVEGLVRNVRGGHRARRDQLRRRGGGAVRRGGPGRRGQDDPAAHALRRASPHRRRRAAVRAQRGRPMPRRSGRGSPTCRSGSASTPTSRSRRTSTSTPTSTACTAEERGAAARAAVRLLPARPVPGPARRPALRRHEAEARPLLRPHPPARAPAARRAHLRRRPALPPRPLADPARDGGAKASPRSSPPPTSTRPSAATGWRCWTPGGWWRSTTRPPSRRPTAGPS